MAASRRAAGLIYTTACSMVVYSFDVAYFRWAFVYSGVIIDLLYRRKFKFMLLCMPVIVNYIGLELCACRSCHIRAIMSTALLRTSTTQHRRLGRREVCSRSYSWLPTTTKYQWSFHLYGRVHHGCGQCAASNIACYWNICSLSSVVCSCLLSAWILWSTPWTVCCGVGRTTQWSTEMIINSIWLVYFSMFS
jgi:hypothetical protein